jgi:hypothetical protein
VSQTAQKMSGAAHGGRGVPADLKWMPGRLPKGERRL